MARKLFLGALAAVAVGFGGSAANAGEPVAVPTGGFVAAYHHHDYVVFVHRGGCWHRYDRFDSRFDAERVARHLERHGHAVRIEVIEVRHGW